MAGERAAVGRSGRHATRMGRAVWPGGSGLVRGPGLRIIAGTLKGRRIETPAWAGLRPTSDRLRETLFNILSPRIQGARVLDGFSGTGAVGLEAISRGAADVMF